MKRHKDTLEHAIKLFGSYSRYYKLIEEMSELTTEIARIGTNRDDPAKLLDELADVLIVCEQMKIILGEKLVDHTIDKKIEKLKRGMDKLKRGLERRQ